ncbi:DUF2127 domain-containing protein [Curtobacterium sp. MCBD17_034]|uniref:DUF2127 domain-containing protein n=1 Tax=unclassified Curtobacterium TaxID=257496 RepID=UPI000DA8D8CD|nr:MULTISPECIES: DUF2127 domain-containing protein [unclassified Curtobacterium]PZF56037.1 DUF2127 domain-containing protein [Curtobacterium sp. MCBD17_034]PZM32905.1 DUF2127 domain-containing protein [Curtobacterium sp. MCBD17_031]
MDSTRTGRGRILDVVFLVGIALKGIDGAAELLLGLPLLFLRPAQISAVAHLLTARELAQDPHDLIAHLILHGAAALGADAALYAAVYLVVHGLVKVVVVIALVRGSERVHPWAIAALAAFLVAQLVEMVVHPSLGVGVLSAFDAAIIVLTWREWRQHRTLRDALYGAVPALARRRTRRRASGMEPVVRAR